MIRPLGKTGGFLVLKNLQDIPTPEWGYLFNREIVFLLGEVVFGSRHDRLRS